jgi:secondary thiamine-phosphate synthase enzyme
VCLVKYVLHQKRFITERNEQKISNAARSISAVSSQTVAGTTQTLRCNSSKATYKLCQLAGPAESVYESIPQTHLLRAKSRKLFQQNKPIQQREHPMPNFKVHNKTCKFATRGEIDFVDLSDKIQEEVASSGIKNGIVHVFAPHATGILILTENDGALLEDIKVFLEELAPKHGAYQHPSNAHSHLRSMLLPPDKTLPVVEGRVEFGTWQSLLFVETDIYPRERTVIIQVMGE